LLVGLLVKLPLAFASTVIPGFSLLKIHDKDLYYCLHMHVFQMGAYFLMKEVLVFLCRCHVHYTLVSAWAYQRCHGILVTMNSVHYLPLNYNKQHLYKVYRGFLLMKACAAGYTFTHAVILKLQFVRWTVVGVTTTKFKHLTFPLVENRVQRSGNINLLDPK
jgi:hypothetical protein